MPELIIMRGISGSGKSTRARQIQLERPGSIIVSRDDLRLALYGKDFGPPINEGFISDIEYNIIEHGLTRGVDVISDNTNLSPRYINPKIATATAMGATVVLEEVNTSLDTAKQRNRSRADAGGRFVPEAVIEVQYEQFLDSRANVAKLFE